MTEKSVILNRAAQLLAQSPSGDISTRAVCVAAGVTQPVLYRLFGDKDGLLSAVADHVWGQYLETKRAAKKSPDPLADLRAGWDSHTAFALANPHAYRLVFGTALAVRPEAFDEAMRLLIAVLSRLAAQGRLVVEPAAAAQVVMAANSGFALGAILRPEAHPSNASHTVREATLRGILGDPDAAGATDPAAVAASTLRERLQTADFTDAESRLLSEWLDRF